MAKQLDAGQHNHLPTFVSSLVNMLNAVHTMAMFSQKDSLNASAVELGAELSQALALTNTAQRELAEKTEAIVSAQKIAASVEQMHAKVQDLEEKSSDAAEAAEHSKLAAAAHAAAVEQTAEEVQKLHTTAKEAADKNAQLTAKVEKALNGVETLQTKSIEQQQIIDSILPKGASAGLAAAFSARENQLEYIKWGWVLVFVTALGVLATMGWHLSKVQSLPSGMTWAEYLVFRGLLASPLIWLAWFSAIQYGNTVRVQEDYAFKQATSKAFQGYRDHMEHLAAVQGEEASTTALDLLAQRTIEILAREPLRIYGKTDSDASPAAGLLSAWRRKPKAEEG
jgi:transcription-repair coupling factor (superfamily II helicase)